jgi:hypothetical protein
MTSVTASFSQFLIHLLKPVPPTKVEAPDHASTTSTAYYRRPIPRQMSDRTIVRKSRTEPQRRSRLKPAAD